MTSANKPNHELVLIVDFGSQVTQLIARRVRECGVYCEVHPYNRTEEFLKTHSPKAIIFQVVPIVFYVKTHRAHRKML